MPGLDLSTNDIAMYQLDDIITAEAACQHQPEDAEAPQGADDNGEKKDESKRSRAPCDTHIDYKRIDELVEASQKLYPDMDRFVLWVMAADYWIQEEYKQESLEISV